MKKNKKNLEMKRENIVGRSWKCLEKGCLIKRDQDSRSKRVNVYYEYFLLCFSEKRMYLFLAKLRKRKLFGESEKYLEHPPSISDVPIFLMSGALIRCFRLSSREMGEKRKRKALKRYFFRGGMNQRYCRETLQIRFFLLRD